MSSVFRITPYSRVRMKFGDAAVASKNTSWCRFYEASPNTFVFQGKQGYEGPYGLGVSYFRPNQTYSARYWNSYYETGTNHRVLVYTSYDPANISSESDNIIAETKLFPLLSIGEPEQFDLSLNGIDLSGARTTSNFSITYCTTLSEFTLNEYPTNPDSSTVLTGTTGSSTNTRTMYLEDSHFGTGEFCTPGYDVYNAYLDSFCKARFGLYLPWSTSMPSQVNWYYNEYYKTWSGPSAPIPGDPDDNAYHIYIDWYFG